MKTIFLHLFLLSLANLSHSLPLSTRSRWITDEATRARVKLACVNWAAHLEPMLAEGLDKKPLGHIAKTVKNMGYNCVRLTWATYMFTRYSTTTVARSFHRLGLHGALDGIARYNPRFLNLTVVDAQRVVIKELVRNGVMVVLDNHISQPMWCCGDHDGNGFFGDRNFDAKEWLHGLKIVAKRYRDTPMVVGMSLRNELRGPFQNSTIWHKYMIKGAKAIQKHNPKLLLIISGLRYDLNFNFLNKIPLKTNFHNKLVYEIHRYAFSNGPRDWWLARSFNRACDKITLEIERGARFLSEGEYGAPLFVSEFGINQMEMGRAENLFLSCFLGYLAEMDLDWSVWALQGGYYLRGGVKGVDESYGMLNKDWSSIRNLDFYHKLKLIQHKIQDPFSTNPTYHILYHSVSAQCIQVNNFEVYVGACRSFSQWNYAGNGYPIQLRDTDLCLSARGDGMPVTLSRDCNSRQSRWESLSDAKFQVASKDERGNYLCLDWDPSNSTTLLTNKCFCLEPDSLVKCLGRPQTQWFKLILGNVQSMG